MAWRAGQSTAGHAHLIAAALMTLAAAFNAVDAAIVRVVAVEVHPFAIGFFRALFGLIVVMPWILARRHNLTTTRLPLHALRAGLKLLSLVAFFAALAHAPLAEVTAIAFAVPIFVTLGAWLILGEKVGRLRALALPIGFIGVIIILDPGAHGIPPAIWLAVIGMLLQATIVVILKRMSADESAFTLVAWNLILSVPLAIIPALFVWTTPSWPILGLLMMQGAFGALNMTLITLAVSMAPASFVAPFDFMRLPFVALLAYVLFGEDVQLTTWIGAGLILLTTALVARSSRNRGANNTCTPPVGTVRLADVELAEVPDGTTPDTRSGTKNAATINREETEE
ncbi:DMT family transporter [Acuticoccus sp. MNP-M23]|uniref:DMT family transporter n=1 Tax=Acuticoccus sp. MNP-M23 TaxID=3072793 RepID=UPI002815C28D|nr:DMT family transporter [Acuticoccus sp. MNP-M23]WMS45065.1 DMT family transporter [Acuticoccus sp. MNP-M23]